MGDVLANAMTWLAGVMSERMAILVTYRRGEQTIADLPATRGKSDYKQEQSDGSTRNMQTTDFLIRCDLLLLDGERIEPADGDKILVTEGDTTIVFRALPQGGARGQREGGTAWRYADPRRTMFRIHVKEFGSE